MNAICLLTHRPHLDWISFLNSFTHKDYKVFIVIDDNNFDLSVFIDYTNITFLTINEKDCLDNGFRTICAQSASIDDYDLWEKNLLTGNLRPTAWEKAIFFFTRDDNLSSYTNTWFIEEDVFIPSMKAITNIDEKYCCDVESIDILCASDVIVNSEAELEDWYWWQHVPKDLLPFPWCHSLNCASRISSRMLNEIREFCLYYKNRNLILFNEYFFQTLAIHKNMRIKAIEELKTIVWRRDWNDKERILSSNLYHPVKDLNSHASLRESKKYL
jgi:hypothetical protein